MSHDHERYEALMMAAVDGVLSAEQQHSWQQHLSQCDSCREEFEDFQHIKQVTDAMTERIRSHGSIEPPRPTSAGRAWLGISMWLVIAGVLIAAVFAGVSLWQNDTLSHWLKAALALITLGALGLFGYALRARVRAISRDPYTEIDQ